MPRDIELEMAFISTEKTKAVHHAHKLVGNREWISATHALIGTGSWQKQCYNERQIAVAETGKHYSCQILTEWLPYQEYLKWFWMDISQTIMVFLIH